jgi:hypothetical protein
MRFGIGAADEGVRGDRLAAAELPIAKFVHTPLKSIEDAPKNIVREGTKGITGFEKQLMKGFK